MLTAEKCSNKLIPGIEFLELATSRDILSRLNLPAIALIDLDGRYQSISN